MGNKHPWTENPSPMEESDKAAIHAGIRYAMGFGRAVADPAGVGADSGGGNSSGTPGGALPAASGGGCGNGGGDIPSVESFLAMGVPTLALARARGVLRPWAMTISSLFTGTDVNTTVTDQNPSNKDKPYADAWCAGWQYKITNTQTANATTLSSMSDFFFNFQSGIQMAVRLRGRPGGNPVPYFTPISAIPGIFCKGFVLWHTEWPQIDLTATIALPWVPQVDTTLNLWYPADECEEYRRPGLAIKTLAREYGLIIAGAGV